VSTTFNLKIILIIILNLYGSNLNEFSCNIKPGVLDMDLIVSSCHKSMIIKNKKNLIL